MSIKILSDKLDSVNLYNKDGNLISRLNGVTDICIHHTSTDEENKLVDYFNYTPFQSFTFTLSSKKLPLWTRIKIKLHLLYLRIVGGYKYWRYMK